MTPSNTGFSRCRPCLGTYLHVTLNHPWTESSSLVFDEALRLERIFNIYDEQSSLSKLNKEGRSAEMAPELSQVLHLAMELFSTSQGAFTPFAADDKTQAKPNYDLNGIAKGFIVDQLSQFLVNLQLSGVVNAGGDLKFFGAAKRQTNVRLGPCHEPVFRSLSSPFDAVATSSFAARALNDSSRTHYPLPLAQHVLESSGCDFTAVCVAKTCAIADAMTKIAMFGSKTLIKTLCEKYEAMVMIFDSGARLQEAFGPQ